MRSRYSIGVPPRVNDEDIEEWLDDLGFGFVDRARLTKKAVAQLNQTLLAALPEASEIQKDQAKRERETAFYYGRVNEFEATFVVTRAVSNSITVRIQHQELKSLELATELFIKKALKIHDKFTPDFSDTHIKILEAGSSHEIIEGIVIPNSFLEAISEDRNNIVVASLSFIISWALLYVLFVVNFDQFTAGETIEDVVGKLATGFVTSTFVSLVGFLQTWYEIDRHKLIKWSFSKRSLENFFFCYQLLTSFVC